MGGGAGGGVKAVATLFMQACLLPVVQFSYAGPRGRFDHAK